MTASAEVLAALAVTAVAPATLPVAAQDCSVGRDGWDNIQRFRRCLEEYNLEQWGDPWLLHTASRGAGNPTIVCLLLQEGWDPNAPDDGGRSPLHHGARNTNPMVANHLLDAGADPNAGDNDGYTARWPGIKTATRLCISRQTGPTMSPSSTRCSKRGPM